MGDGGGEWERVWGLGCMDACRAGAGRSGRPQIKLHLEQRRYLVWHETKPGCYDTSMAARPVSRIAFCSGVRFDVPQEEGPNQDSRLELSASPIPQATTRRLSPLHLLSSSVGRVVLGVLCVEPRITSYALDRSFRYVFLADRRTAQTRRCCALSYSRSSGECT